MEEKISIIGLGKLGSSMAAAVSDRGYNVIGMDINTATVEKINNGLAPVKEPGLNELIRKNKSRLHATSSCEQAVHSTSLSFVIVPTPSLDDGSFSLEYAAATFHEIGKALKNKSEYHNIVLTSTVLPGSTRYGLLPVLENASGKKCGKEFGLCYSPLFIALGSVVKNFLYPDFTLIGEFDTLSGEILERFYRSILQNDSPCKRMSIENAEITKISLNTFVTTKVAFTNMISELCDNIPGGNVDIVTDALGTDTRIGPKYLKGGLGYGGPCFPRDNQALSFISKSVGVQADLAEITDKMNRNRPEQILKHVISRLPAGETVAVLGLAYKPATPVVDASQSVMLCEMLHNSGFNVIAYDPQINKDMAPMLPNIQITENLDECLALARVIFITTTDPQFLAIEADQLKGTAKQQVLVVDCWRFLKEQLSDRPGIIYLSPGCNSDITFNDNKLKKIWGKNQIKLREEVAI